VCVTVRFSGIERVESEEFWKKKKRKKKKKKKLLEASRLRSVLGLET
jgi:hypothetical protein